MGKTAKRALNSYGIRRRQSNCVLLTQSGHYKDIKISKRHKSSKLHGFATVIVTFRDILELATSVTLFLFTKDNERGPLFAFFHLGHWDKSTNFSFTTGISKRAKWGKCLTSHYANNTLFKTV